jgi:hypothetical protein
MSAGLLRQAASLMRERAEAATPSPWARGIEFAAPSEVWHEGDAETLMVCDTADAYSAENRPGELALEDAEHIASWHPAVALAVADWLDAEAARAERWVAWDRAYDEKPDEGEMQARTRDIAPAHAVATAYLGGES